MLHEALRPFLLAGAALVAVSSLGAAQLVGPGLTWKGSSGTFAGGYFPGCSPDQVSFGGGETVEVTVWGDDLAPFWLAAAPSTSGCLPVPGIGGGFALSTPFVVLSTGVLSRTSPCLACPPGSESFLLRVPGGLPPGFTLSLQALTFGANVPAFTVPITASSK